MSKEGCIVEAFSAAKAPLLHSKPPCNSLTTEADPKDADSGPEVPTSVWHGTMLEKAK